MTRVALTLGGLATAGAALIATAIIWLCITEPAMMANAIGTGHAGSVLKVVAAVVVSALGRVVRSL